MHELVAVGPELVSGCRWMKGGVKGRLVRGCIIRFSMWRVGLLWHILRIHDVVTSIVLEIFGPV